MAAFDHNTVAIVNPAAGGRKAQELWPAAEAALRSVYGKFDTFVTERPGQAEEIARDALTDGATEILVFGGDGSISEVVNGIQVTDGAETILTVIPSGTGGDFRKTFNIPPKPEDFIAGLENRTPRKIDLGKITFVDWDGQEQVRYFANIASFGLSGEVDKAVNAATWPKKLGGRFTYAWCTLAAMNKYAPMKVRLFVDDAVDTLVRFNTVAVCNGQFFGGGMHVAPIADPSDGLLDIIAIEPQSALSGLRNAPKLYKGAHLDEPNVRSWKGKRVSAVPADPSQSALLDIDGEPLGKLPATFEIIPGAISLRV